MRIAIVWLTLGASVSLGQTTTPRPGTDPIITALNQFPPQLTEYLGLSVDQVVHINAINSQLASAQSSKAPRQYQLQSEITQELAKPTPDPLALGVRYAELESIRRDLQNQQVATFGQTQAVLNAAQKTKLTTLQQALTLYSTACSAIDQNLIPPFPGNIIPTGRVGDIYASFLIGTFSSGCNVYALSTFVRTGDFSATIPAPGPLRP